MGQQEIREDAEGLNNQSDGNTPLKDVDPSTSNETNDSHNRASNKPAGRPKERDIDLAVRIGKKRRIIIEMAVCGEKRRSILEAWKAEAEVISETIRDTTRAEYAVSMRKFAVNRVDIIVEIYSSDGAESCVT